MKKLFKFIPLLLLAVVGLAFASCSDDKDEPVSVDKLPAAAQTFIAQYYPSATVVSSTKDNDEYEVILSEGTRIDFNKQGEWTDVDAPAGQTVPKGFYPSAIDTYLDSNLGGLGINEIAKENRGYDVELTSGTDLLFSYEGILIGFDS